MRHRAPRKTNRLALSGILAVILLGGVASAAVAIADVTSTADTPAAAAVPSRSPRPALITETPTATPKPKASPSKKPAPKVKKLPAGTTTATSFWDAETASGRSMRYATLASPYWPLGTKVKITYGGKSAIGIVDDFGPAEWAVAQHSPPALVDLSELMMQDFTGTRSNTITAKFEVLSWGTGGVYRHSGTGYDTAMGE
jgi:hypothetical protein